MSATRLLTPLLVALLSTPLLTLSPRLASAYSCEGLVREGCHERITSEALRRVREEPDAAPREQGSRNERALIDDVQFDLEGDMKDLGAVTLLVGVRDNDLKGLSVDDLSALAEIHGDPDNQDEHCLRGSNHVEPGGTEGALDDCRDFIRRRVLEALDGLDEDGQPDLNARTELTLYLSLRGQVDADLPAYYVRMGQALHALQDSFTHAYRTPDGLQVTVLVDYVDLVTGKHSEERDGPEHVSELDQCTGLDEFRSDRREVATRASTELLQATLGAGSREEKVAAVDLVLDTYLVYSAGCTFENDWCDAVERQYGNGSTCGVAGAGVGLGSGVWVALMTLAGLALLRSSRRRTARITVVSGLVVAGTLALGTVQARADEPTYDPATAAAVEDRTGVPPPPIVPVPEPGPRNPNATTVGAYLGAFGSISKGAIGGQFGLRVRLSKHWTFGLDGEWNPWLSYNGPDPVRRGVVNAYGTAILRFPLIYMRFNLATTVNLGVSYLLDDLYAAPKGSMGPYFGVSPLGLEWKVSRAFLIIVNPLSLAVPVPKVTGIPLWFPQYRFTIGIAVMAG